MDKITIERETLERAIADYDSAAGNDGTLLSWNRARDNLLALLRAALAAQPAPAAVPTGKQDAARYQMLRRGQHWSVINGIGDELRAEALDAAIDSAMIAAARDKP